MKKLTSALLLGAALGLIGGSAAATVSGGSGAAVPADVNLNFQAASQLHYAAGLDPQSSGPTGGSFSFDGAFSGAGSHNWIRLGKFDFSADNGAHVTTGLLGAPLTISFDKFGARSGMWVLTNSSSTIALKLDLVFAAYTGSGNGAFLFNDHAIGTATNHIGTWNLNMVDQDGAPANYANLTVFARDASRLPDINVSIVPEPAGYAMLAAGLGLFGLLSLRRRDSGSK